MEVKKAGIDIDFRMSGLEEKLDIVNRAIALQNEGIERLSEALRLLEDAAKIQVEISVESAQKQPEF